MCKYLFLPRKHRTAPCFLLFALQIFDKVELPQSDRARQTGSLLLQPRSVRLSRVYNLGLCQCLRVSQHAFASPALAAELHRQHGYRVRFNDEPKYPQILENLEEVEIPNRLSRPTSEQP
jgi:hypothetical protein